MEEITDKENESAARLRTDIIKETIFYIPLCITIVYCIGAFDLITYYLFFGFNIIPFLSFEDLTIAAISDLIYLVPIFLVLLLLIFITQKTVLYALNSRVDSESRHNRKSKSGRIIYKYFKIPAGIVLLLWPILSIYVLYNEVNSDFLNQNFFKLLISSYVVLFFFLALVIILNLENKYIKNYKSFNTFCFIILFSMITSFDASVYKVQNIQKNHSSNGTYIVIQNSETKMQTLIKSDMNYYYIGKSAKFVFYFNSKSKIIDIFPENIIIRYSINR